MWLKIEIFSSCVLFINRIFSDLTVERNEVSLPHPSIILNMQPYAIELRQDQVLTTKRVKFLLFRIFFLASLLILTVDCYIKINRKKP